MRIGPPTLTPNSFTVGAGLLCDVARRVVGVEEVVFRIEQGAVPDLVEVAVKCVGSGFGEVVDLRHGIPALIDGEGIGVDRRLLHGVEADDEVGGEADVEAQPGIVGVVAVEDVAVGGCGQAVELDVAVAARGLGVVGGAGGVHQRALRKLREVGQVLAGVGQALDGLCLDGGGGIGVVEAEQSLLPVTSTVWLVD